MKSTKTGWLYGVLILLLVVGFGLTGPNPEGRYDIGSYTRFLRDLFDKLDVRQATVAGNSFGGYVAWKMAVDHPERVARLILVDAGGYAYQAQSVPIGFKLAQIPALKPVMSNLLPRRMVESSVRNVYGDPSKVTPELVDRYDELTLRAGNREALSGRFAQSKGGEFEAQIVNVQQPTLIIWGSEDHLIPPDNAERFHRDIRNSRLIVFSKLGHVPHEEDPAATASAAKAFIEQP